MKHLRCCFLPLVVIVIVAPGCQAGDVVDDLATTDSALSAGAFGATAAQPFGACPFPSANTLTAAAAPALSAVDAGERLDERIEVSVRVRDEGAHLRLDLRFYNPYRCHWRGSLYVEQVDPSGEVETLARRYRALIRGGTAVSGTLSVLRPAGLGDYRFLARAYHPSGEDREVFENCLTSSSALEEACAPSLAAASDLFLADEVLKGTLGGASQPTLLFADAGCGDLRPERPPIHVDIYLRARLRVIQVFGEWENVTREDWKGDLYVDMTDPDGQVSLLHRDLGVPMAAGIGFCTYQEIPRPSDPGRYLFQARALRRDGSAAASWSNPGTTEIFAVCNSELCELIEPERERARIVLTGRSYLHLESDFFSEHTTVTMAWGQREFDITRLCRIRQEPMGGRNHVEVAFDTMNLPIGPRTWARYDVQLHPMPVVPPGAKTNDAIWVLTNGPE